MRKSNGKHTQLRDEDVVSDSTLSMQREQKRVAKIKDRKRKGVKGMFADLEDESITGGVNNGSTVNHTGNQ